MQSSLTNKKGTAAAIKRVSSSPSSLLYRHRTLAVSLAVMLYLLSSSSLFIKNKNQKISIQHKYYPLTYDVCNGLSNQWLGHAAHISEAIVAGRNVMIPNVYIVHGVQSEKEMC